MLVSKEAYRKWRNDSTTERIIDQLSALLPYINSINDLQELGRYQGIKRVIDMLHDQESFFVDYSENS